MPIRNCLRITVLEELIPQKEDLLSRTPRKNYEDYAHLELEVYHLRLEYRERTGRDYSQEKPLSSESKPQLF